MTPFLRKTLVAAGIALGLLGGAQAVPLADLLGGSSLTAGNLIFDGFSVTAFSASDPARSFNPANVDVSVLTDGGADPGQGLLFTVSNEELSVVGDDVFAFVDLALSFRASTTSAGWLIKGATTTIALASVGSSTGLNDGSNDNGSYIHETYGGGAGLSDLGVNAVEFSYLNSVQTSLLTQSAAFAPVGQVWASKNILVWATEATDDASLTSFEQRFSPSPIPEPATVLLLATGLAVLVMARRSRV